MRDTSIAGLVKVLAKDCKMRITVSGEGSYIDHDGNINIAVMPDTPRGRMLATGLAFHEVGHKNYSNLKSKPAGLVGHIANIIEDIWTERRTILERPGTRFNLDEVTTHYANSGNLTPKNLNQGICGKTMAYGRRTFLGQQGIGVIEPTCEEFMDDAFGQAFIDELVGILQDIPSINASEEAIEMAKKIEQLVINQKPKPQPPTQSNQMSKSMASGGSDEECDESQACCQSQADGDESGGQGEEDSEESSSDDADDVCNKGDVSGDESEDETGEQARDDDSSNSSEDGSGDDSDSQSAKSSNATSDGAGGTGKLTEEEIDELLNEEDSYGDFGELIQAELDELACMSDSERLSIPLLPKMSRDTYKHPKLDEVKAISASSRMRAKMMGMLQDEKRCPESYGSSGKKLKTGRLEKYALGDARIFSRKKLVKQINTAVVICGDYSGSMSSSTRISNPATFSVHNALYGLKGAAVATVGFGTCTGNGDQELLLLVNFKEKPTSDKFNLQACGGTPTHEAIWAARAMLLERPEPRKIILIVTDGDPDCRTSTKEATARTERDGIEVAAIGIETSCVKHLWKKSKCINRVEELPEAMFTVMDELLLGRN